MVVLEQEETTNRVLALDIGSKRTGVAISDDSCHIALPLTYISADGKEDWMRQIRSLIDTKGVGSIVVGLPLNQFGEEGEDALNIRKFIALLQERVSIPVIEWDERFTTVQAERILIDADISRQKRKTMVDRIAATILLQSYLDSCSHQTPGNDI